jgi:KRAB domain-containing zinc finger protein
MDTTFDPPRLTVPLSSAFLQDCGMTFKLKHSMKKHQLTHKAEFGHTCDICGKKFKVSRVARSNCSLLTYKGEFGHTCDICGKKFKVNRVVRSNCSLLTHKAEFGHTCDICGKKFKVSRLIT